MKNYRFVRAFVAIALSVLPLSVLADGIEVTDPYARASRPQAPTGAAFMEITNTGTVEDRLISVTSEAAMRVELHSHIDQGDGVMKMVEIENGIPLPVGATHVLKRGGDHVMLMGLIKPLAQGGEIELILSFERAGEMLITVPVDNARSADHKGSGGHNH